MKKPLAFLIGLLAFHAAHAQWTWQNPLPQGNGLYSIYFPDANTGYAAGLSGTIIKTTTQIDISDLQTGIYFFRYVNEKGLQVGKIIKE
jgi:hypothetical protein